MSNPYANFKHSKRFSGENQLITTLDFDDSGQFLLATSINKSIQLYDALKGRFQKAVQSQKYGCHLAKFTHNSQQCIYASSMQTDDHTIRYLSLNDNSFIRYFRGHKNLVNSLEVNPTQDLIVSASLDNTIKLWDLRSSNFQGSTPMQGPSFTAFDPSGLVLAIGSDLNQKDGMMKSTFQLSDIRMFTTGPFLNIDLPSNFTFNKVEFSNDNKYILISSLTGNHLVYDSFEGKMINELAIGSNVPLSEWPNSGTACFTPDSKYVLSGTGDGSISIFEIDKSKNGGVITPSSKLVSTYDTQPRMVLFNPKFQEFVSADSNINFWIPDN